MQQSYKIILALSLVFLSKSAVSAEMIHVKVKGFVCALCGQGVEKKLNATSKNGIENYVVDMDSKVVSFNLKPGIKLSDENITQAITKAGYAVENIQHESSAVKEIKKIDQNTAIQTEDKKSPTEKK